MKTFTLTETERWTIVNAMHAGRLQYESDAEFYSADNAAKRGETMPAAARERMVRQFNDQAAEARRLAELVENADAITIT